MLFSFLGSTVLFALVCIGLGWPVVARRALEPAEKLVAAVTLSLIAVFLVAWLVYIAPLPVSVFWLLPVGAVAGLAARRTEFVALLRDSTVREITGAQALLAAWCVGWLATVATYSGGGWAADWYEHWERTRFFLQHGDLETKFIGRYALTARPPLANVVTGAFLRLSRIDFAHYQLVSTLFASLAFLPAVLLARRWGSRRAIFVLALLAMVSPLFVQNATFAWTKLPTAFFVLVALHFFLRRHDALPAASAAPLCAASLAAAVLTHYSAGPYCVMLALGWLYLGRPQWRTSAWWRTTGAMILIGALLLATWFGWSLAVYGAGNTFLTNSSVTSADARQGNQALKIALNVYDTVVPHFLRTLDQTLITQRSAWGAWRDWLFQCYQVNLLFAFGGVAWIVIMRELPRVAVTAPPRARLFWGAFILGTIFLGIATHGQRDHWGLAHICLQALVVLGLAFLAARWENLGRGWRMAVIAGATVDLLCGIVLHFGVQSFALERWLAPGRSMNDTFATLSEPAQMNLLAKVEHRVAFFADVTALPLGVIAFVLLVVLTTTLGCAHQSAGRPRANQSP